MIKSIKRFFQQRRERYRIPRRVQDLIPIDGIWNDGIFHGGNAYSKTYRFSDINYKVASDEDQHDMFLGYSAILNGDAIAGVHYKYDRQMDAYVTRHNWD